MQSRDRVRQVEGTAQGRGPWPVVGTVCIGAFMAALDASIVTIALPTLHVFFHTSLNTLDWVAIAYLLTLSSLLLIFGRLADHFGRSRMYTYGFGVFIVGSALCGAAPSVYFLIGSRILQAAGAAMLQANSVALVTQHTPPGERGRAIGIQGAAQALGLSAGPAVGGALLALFSWRALFYVNVPVGILGTVLAFRLLPRDARGEPIDRFDYAGALMMVVALVGILWPLNNGYKAGWGSPPVLGSLAAGLVAAWLFVRREKLIPAPILNMDFFKSFAFSAGNVSGMLSYTLMYGASFLGPFEFRYVQHLPVSQQGLVLTAIPVAMTVLSPISGRMADRLGSKGLTVGGMAIGAAGAFLLALTSSQGNFLPIISGLLLIGAGMGLFTAPNNSSVMGVVRRHELSAAGGFLNMARSVGMSIGVAVAGSIYAGYLLSTIRTETPGPGQGGAAGHALLLAYAGVGVAAVVAALVSAMKPRSRGAPSDPGGIDLV